MCLYTLHSDKTVNLHLYNQIRHVGRPAFSRINIIFEEGITDIGEVVTGDSVDEITIPSTVTNIADNAFVNCSSLTNLILNIVNSSNVNYSTSAFRNVNLRVVTLPYNAINYDLFLASLGVSHVNYTVGTESGFGRWVLVSGLAGQGSRADFGGRQQDKSVANGFLYVFGDNLQSESELMHLEFKNGRFLVRTPDEVNHDGAIVRVLGSNRLGDWADAIEMKQTSEGWVMPDGTKPPESFFFKMEVLERR